MALGDAHRLPIAIVDKDYDSDPLREQLVAEEILLLAPHASWPNQTLLQRWPLVAPL